MKESKAPKKDSGPKFHMLVRISSLALIGGVFLKFLLDQSILELWNSLTGDLEAEGVGPALKALIASETAMGSLLKFGFIAGFLLFPIVGLLMLIRGRYSGGQFTFLLVYNLAMFLLVMFFGEAEGISGNFFANAGLGYWIACAGVVLPFIGMFFIDESI